MQREECYKRGSRELVGDRREKRGDQTLKWPASHTVPELNIQNKQSLKIHVVEAGKEFDLVMVFWVSPSRPEGWALGWQSRCRVGPRSASLSFRSSWSCSPTWPWNYSLWVTACPRRVTSSILPCRG